MVTRGFLISAWLRGAPVIAATSRAMPVMLRQSPRLGVGLVVMIQSSRSGSTCSTSMPPIASASASARAASGGLTKLRSQLSGNFMRSVELLQEAQVVLEEQPQVAHAITQHCEPVGAEPEGEALELLALDTHVPQYVGVHHARTAQLEPAAAEAHVDLGGRLGERKKRWPEAHLHVV